MPINERTFADRLQRGRDIHAATVDFNPAFAPADASLIPSDFSGFLENVEEKNEGVTAALEAYGEVVDDRTALAKDLKLRTTRALAYIKSNKAWAKHLDRIKKVADRIRGVTATKPKPPGEGEGSGSPAAKKRNTGERSYADLEGLVAKLNGLLAKVTGYAPPATELTLVEMQAAQTALRGLNLSVPDKDSDLAKARDIRLAIYEGPDGLREKMLAIKEATKSQYGTSSAEYGNVKGIRV